MTEGPNFQSIYGFTAREVDRYFQMLADERARLVAAISQARARKERASRLSELLSRLEEKVAAVSLTAQSQTQWGHAYSAGPLVPLWQLGRSASGASDRARDSRALPASAQFEEVGTRSSAQSDEPRASVPLWANSGSLGGGPAAGAPAGRAPREGGPELLAPGDLGDPDVRLHERCGS